MARKFFSNNVLEEVIRNGESLGLDSIDDPTDFEVEKPQNQEKDGLDSFE